MPATPQMLPEQRDISPTAEEKSASEHLAVQVPWQKDLRSSIRNLDELCHRLNLNSDELPNLRTSDFPLLVTDSFLARMEQSNPQDPLLRQILPLAEELHQVEGFVSDPVGDLRSRQGPGMIHKYQGRVLLMVAGSCAIHCRYCFRREYPYAGEPKSLQQWEQTFQQIETDSTISEVILSGGDPLMMSDDRLSVFLQRLEIIRHLQRIRIHSRLPVVLPGRVTDSLISLLQNSRLQPVMVIHANHPQELTADCAQAVQRLVKSGIPTLNQAVLLKGVNDDLETLKTLCERSINLGVMPYYLHQLDRVNGTAHFEVSVEKGLQLIEQLRQVLPGYAVPRYVQEVAGESAKSPIT